MRKEPNKNLERVLMGTNKLNGSVNKVHTILCTAFGIVGMPMHGETFHEKKGITLEEFQKQLNKNFKEGNKDPMSYELTEKDVDQAVGFLQSLKQNLGFGKKPEKSEKGESVNSESQENQNEETPEEQPEETKKMLEEEDLEVIRAMIAEAVDPIKEEIAALAEKVDGADSEEMEESASEEEQKALKKEIETLKGNLGELADHFEKLLTYRSAGNQERKPETKPETKKSIWANSVFTQEVRRLKAKSRY